MNEISSYTFHSLLEGEIDSITEEIKHLEKSIIIHSNESNISEIEIRNAIIKNIDKSSYTNWNICCDVTIISCLFNDGLNLKDVKSNHTLKFIDCKFEETIKIYDSSFFCITFLLSTSRKDLFIINSDFDILSFSDSVIHSILILNSFFLESLFLVSSSIKSFLLSKASFVHSIILNSNFDNFKISNGTNLNNVTLKKELAFKNTSDFKNISIHKLNFINFNNSGRLLFYDVQINSFSTKPSMITLEDFFHQTNFSENQKKILLNNYHPFKKLNLENKKLYRIDISESNPHYELVKSIIFSNKKSNSRLLIENCDIGSLEFKNVELHKFKEVKIINTELSNLKTFNSNFLAKNIIGSNISVFETFNDLYTVAKNKNNKKEQQEYYIASQQALLKHYLRNKPFKNLSSILSLITSKIFSNYGSDWIKSSFVTIVIGIFCFTIMIFSSGYYSIDLSNEAIFEIRKFIPYFFKFILPTHNINFMDDLDNNTFSSLIGFTSIDFIARILISIGIFETIRAFRKNVRQ